MTHLGCSILPNLTLGAKEWFALCARVTQYWSSRRMSEGMSRSSSELKWTCSRHQLDTELTQSVVDLVVRPLLVQAGHHPGAIQDGHQVP